MEVIKEEIEFLMKLESIAEKKDRHILEAIYREVRKSHERIYNRTMLGYKYSIGVDKGKIYIDVEVPDG